VVMDFWLADGASLELLHQLQQQCRTTKFLIVSGDDDIRIAQKIRESGAQGYLLKHEPPEKMIEAIKKINHGGTWHIQGDNLLALNNNRHFPITTGDLGLTQRQEEILALVLRGLPNKRIASTLNLSEQTVKEHITAILGKLGVRNRVEAITLLQNRRFVS
jgi:DNA-binding NarL/FixJ family response regulator